MAFSIAELVNNDVYFQMEQESYEAKSDLELLGVIKNAEGALADFISLSGFSNNYAFVDPIRRYELAREVYSVVCGLGFTIRENHGVRKEYLEGYINIVERNVEEIFEIENAEGLIDGIIANNALRMKLIEGGICEDLLIKKLTSRYQGPNAEVTPFQRKVAGTLIRNYSPAGRWAELFIPESEFVPIEEIKGEVNDEISLRRFLYAWEKAYLTPIERDMILKNKFFSAGRQALASEYGADSNKVRSWIERGTSRILKVFNGHAEKGVREYAEKYIFTSKEFKLNDLLSIMRHYQLKWNDLFDESRLILAVSEDEEYEQRTWKKGEHGREGREIDKIKDLMKMLLRSYSLTHPSEAWGLRLMDEEVRELFMKGKR